jgi:hypothetical protein
VVHEAAGVEEQVVQIAKRKRVTAAATIRRSISDRSSARHARVAVEAPEVPDDDERREQVEAYA